MGAEQHTTEESEAQRIERLGRERPPTFPTLWSEIGFIFSVTMSQILTEFFVTGFIIILPRVTADLDIPEASSVWPATAFSLSVAATLLFFGRLGDQHGGYIVYILGLIWLAVWSLIAGFSNNFLMMTICRALQGLGPAAFLPTGVELIGSIYRPGPRKNLVFALYGSSAVLGFFIGIFCAGMVAQFIRFGWYFWIGAILSILTVAAAIFCIPNDREEKRKNNIENDWLGAAVIISGLVLLVFSITESAHAPNGWRTPYIPTLFSISIVLLLLAVWIEGWVAKRPLMPPDVFGVPSMTPLTISIFLLYGTMGMYILYATQYFQEIMGAGSLQVVAWYTPMAIVGMCLALIEGLLLHIVHSRVLMGISAASAMGAMLMLALIPRGANYWAFVFPSTILSTMGIDLSITLMMVFVTTKLPLARQGLAGGLINSSLQLGMALSIGLGDIIKSQTQPYAGIVKSYKNVFWFGVALGAFAFVLIIIWADIPKAKSDMTADEYAELERIATRESQAQGEKS